MFICRASNNAKQYREMAHDNLALQAKLNDSNKKLQAVQARIGQFQQREESLQNMRRDVHTAEARVLESERSSEDLKRERDRALDRFAISICEYCIYMFVYVHLCDCLF